MQEPSWIRTTTRWGQVNFNTTDPVTVTVPAIDDFEVVALDLHA